MGYHRRGTTEGVYAKGITEGVKKKKKHNFYTKEIGPIKGPILKIMGNSCAQGVNPPSYGL